MPVGFFRMAKMGLASQPSGSPPPATIQATDMIRINRGASSFSTLIGTLKL